MTRIPLRALAAVSLAAAVGLWPAYAGACKPVMTPPAGAELKIVVHGGDTPNGPVLDEAFLRCNPDGGTHPLAAEACTALKAVDGDFGKVAVRDRVCTMEYAPVTVTVGGHWYGKTVEHMETFGNRCAAGAKVVYDI